MREKTANKVKVHYVGFPKSDDDGALGRLLPCYVPSDVSLEDRAGLFCDCLSKKIKRSLYSLKRESPEVRVGQEVENDVFNHLFKNIGTVKINKGRKVHCVDSHVEPSLNNLFGNKWSERILNANGDFCNIVKGTIQFWTHKNLASNNLSTLVVHCLRTRLKMS